MDETALNLALYHKIYLSRRVEEVIRAHYPEQEMKTPMHMSEGAEAIAAGVCQALQPTDPVLGTHRSHALYFAKTLESDRFFAEMYGKATGMVRGRGGSMHLIAPEEGLVCISSIVAANIPVALGVAFAARQRGLDEVTAVFFGDGAVDEGAFWESLNAACLMRLPLMFVCEDNGLAVHNPASARHGYDSISRVAATFDCDVHRSDSSDAREIHALARDARAAIRSRNRPAFLHLHYGRYLEHVGICEDFDAGYRSRESIIPWLERDPVTIMRRALLASGDEERLTALEARIDAQVETSLRLAREAPFPELSDLYTDLYA